MLRSVFPCIEVGLLVKAASELSGIPLSLPRWSGVRSIDPCRRVFRSVSSQRRRFLGPCEDRSGFLCAVCRDSLLNRAKVGPVVSSVFRPPRTRWKVSARTARACFLEFPLPASPISWSVPSPSDVLLRSSSAIKIRINFMTARSLAHGLPRRSLQPASSKPRGSLLRPHNPRASSGFLSPNHGRARRCESAILVPASPRFRPPGALLPQPQDHQDSSDDGGHRTRGECRGPGRPGADPRRCRVTSSFSRVRRGRTLADSPEVLPEALQGRALIARHLPSDVDDLAPISSATRAPDIRALAGNFRRPPFLEKRSIELVGMKAQSKVMESTVVIHFCEGSRVTAASGGPRVITHFRVSVAREDRRKHPESPDTHP